MDVSLLIKQRLAELGLDQKDLAEAAQVTESYVSQLLARKKAPPAPNRTEIYDRIGEFLRLPSGELSKLAEIQRQEQLKKKVAEPPEPLYQGCRESILGKCEPSRRGEVQRIFEKEPFGELERLVAQKLVEVALGVAAEESTAKFSGGEADASAAKVSAAEISVAEISRAEVSMDNCAPLLDARIGSWDIDLKTFALEVALHAVPARTKRFEFMERDKDQSLPIEPGFEQFLNDPVLSAGVTEEEIEFLRKLRFNGRRPGPIYYYRELQNLRDPLHFTTRPAAPQSPRGSESGTEPR